MTMANDVAAAYQCALRYWATGDTRYADKAVEIMNAWSATLTTITGDSNALLAGGLQGYQWACAGELMRNYSGWASADFARFQNMMLTIFYPICSDFLIRHNGTCISHYWANWDLCAMTAILGIGVVCDDRAKYNEAVNYFKSGAGMGAIGNAVYFMHPGYLGQWQESGRDQGHATLGPGLMGPFCEIAWNQGDDLYGYLNNSFLAGSEYVAKYNLTNTVPYITYANCENAVQPVIAGPAAGVTRPYWEMLYNHFVNRKGLAAPYTQQSAAIIRPEGGGGNYGSTSGGYDQLGFGTLTHSLDPIASGAVPSGLTAMVVGTKLTLSWVGSAYATSYNVKRATISGGPYTTIANVVNNTYTDTGVQGTTYFYVVSALSPGEGASSTQLSVTPNDLLTGTIIGSAGSYLNLGATKECVFDGGLRNYYDAANVSGDWAGLDLGTAYRITQIQYCPRTAIPGRMVGGVFQGANVADFTSGVVTLFTVSATPPTEVLTAQTITDPGTYRYVRYLGPVNGSCNVGEVQFFGSSGAPPPPPAAPTGLTATAASSSQINLSWTASSGATSYNVKRATVSGGPYTTVATGVLGTTYSNTGLTASTTYYYVVSAVNAGGESPNSTQAGAATLSGGSVPVAPTGLTATPGNAQVSLSWTASSGATSYNVKRATVSGGPYTTVATGVTGTSYVNTGLVNGTTYFYVVSAVNAVGESPNSAQVSATPSAGSLPPAPTGLTATLTGNDTDVQLSWTAVSGATSYKVKRATVNGGPYTVVATPATNTYTDTSAKTQGTTYYYVVSAVNATGEGPNSTQVSIVP